MPWDNIHGDTLLSGKQIVIAMQSGWWFTWGQY